MKFCRFLLFFTASLFSLEQPPLPQYVEAGYSPLGRSPVVDACLENPFSMPDYAYCVADLIRANGKKGLSQMGASVLGAGEFRLGSLGSSSPCRRRYLIAF